MIIGTVKYKDMIESKELTPLEALRFLSSYKGEGFEASINKGESLVIKTVNGIVVYPNSLKDLSYL